MEKQNTVQYYLKSPQKKAKDFRHNNAYKKILTLALQNQVKTDDIYQKTDVAEGRKERGRIIGTMIKNLVQWGFLSKTGNMDKLYRQEIFSLNETFREEIRRLVEG